MEGKKRYMPLPKGYRLNVNKFEDFCRVVGLSLYLLAGVFVLVVAFLIAFGFIY